jgi:hypothetical protein
MIPRSARTDREPTERHVPDPARVALAATGTPGRSLDSSVQTKMRRELAFAGLDGRRPASAPAQTADVISNPRGQEEIDAATRAERVLQDRPARTTPSSRQSVDLTGVLVHTDDRAASAAQALDADAFTVGNHIVFGEAAYRPAEGDGQRLLAHELAHVLTPSSTLVHRQKAKSPTKTKSTTDDYDDANTYITDFYINHDRLLTDLYLAIASAVENFADLSKAPLPSDVKAPPMATIKLVLSLTPGSQEAMLALELWEKLWPVASEVADLAGPTPHHADPLEAASEARTAALTPHLVTREALAKRQQHDRDELRKRRDAAHSGPQQTLLLPQTRASVGEIPHYSADVIRTFGMNYELDLYRRYYSVNGGISRKEPYTLGAWAKGGYTTYEIVAIPDAVVKRIVDLYKALNRVPKVSIDDRYDPKHAVLVAHLIDLDVPVINYLGTLARSGATVTAEERKRAMKLHTGDDLQQPYRGERYREVK